MVFGCQRGFIRFSAISCTAETLVSVIGPLWVPSGVLSAEGPAALAPPSGTRHLILL